MIRFFGKAVVAAVGCVMLVAPAAGRDYIMIVGSSTVFPYTQAVTEQFMNMNPGAEVVPESTGTGGGMKLFCAGIGAGHPDITGASRAMKSSEHAKCQENGVTDITEALIGFDGLSIAISRESGSVWDLTLEQVYLALADRVPVDGKMVKNPNMRWSDIDPSLPDQPILFYGPPPTSGTRDAFVELAMHAGCEALDYVRNGGFDGNWIKENCSRMRVDGQFIEAGENDNLIVRSLAEDPTAMGIFGYSFLFENLDVLKPVKINGIEPDAATIGDKSYPVSRPLYFYTKNAHRNVIPNLQAFIEEYVSEEALAPDGYLSERGLVSLPDDQRSMLQDAVINGVTISAK
ncbi:MAG: substrate-binding domain-containing protein [Rhodobacteraceae bacterium]|nr:substrate-binding domain-containing protein [Paracoccaceae bacterium]